MKEIPAEKVCTDCGQKKASSEFHRAGFARDGLQRTCKQCRKTSNEWGKKYQEELRDVGERFLAAGPFAKSLVGITTIPDCTCDLMKETFRKGGRPHPEYVCHEHQKSILAAIEQNSFTVSVTITNSHIPSSGDIPLWARRRPEGSYFGYFDNSHGEQWIFLATKDQMRLAGGDVGWGSLYEETKPDWKALTNAAIQPGVVVLFKGVVSDAFKDLVFDAPEAAWLTACVQSAAERFGG